MRALLPVLVLALTIYALLDCARTPEELMPARMPKVVWIVLIVFFFFKQKTAYEIRW